MAKRKGRKRAGRVPRPHKKAIVSPKRISPSSYKRIIKSGFLIKRPRRISDARLERGLRVLMQTKDISTAARAIRATPEKFKRAAKRRRAIRKRGGHWNVVGRLPRKMPIFSDGKQLAITVRSKSASQIGAYMSAVRKFLRTNDPSGLAEFKNQGVKDVKRKTFPFEINPNALYRLSSAGGEPFEQIYRIVL